MDKQFNVAIAKTDEQEMTATGLVYSPLVIDSQGDFMTADDIRVASQQFLKSGKTRNIDVNHSGVAIDAFVAESMIAKEGDDFPAGSWLATIKIEDAQIWKAVRDKKLRGLSLLGNGTRTVAKLNGKTAKRITDLDVQAISLVSKAANQEEFSVIKSDTDPMAYLAKQMEALAKHMMATNEAIKAIKAQQKTLDTSLASLTTGSDGRVFKAEPIAQRDPEIDRLLRKQSRLQERLESIFERPDMFHDGAEDEVRKSIQKTEDRLYAYGHETERATLDSGSAFLMRGGRSDFLQATPSPLDDILGISRNTRGLQKSEDEINVTNCLVL